MGAKIADAAAIPMFVAAGLMNLSYRRFLMWTAAATLPKAGLLMVIGYVAGGQALALAGRLEPRWAVSLALLALVTVTYPLVAKKILFRGAHNPSHTLTQGGKR